MRIWHVLALFMLLGSGLMLGRGQLWCEETPSPPDQPAPNIATSYDFPVDTVRMYHYDLDHTVAWSSAGDELTYQQTLKWTFFLRATAVVDGVATVNATVVRVAASSQGPGYERSFDSRTPPPQADPLFGHLAALEGITLTLTIQQTSGAVTAVHGGATLIARMEALMPATQPGKPSPFAADLAALYSDESLARWWSALLVLPGSPAPLPLTAGQPARIERTWDADTFTLRLPKDGTQPVTLANDPTPVTGTLADLTGTGTVSLADGMPAAQTGELSYTLTLQALTQAVQQKHQLRWTLSTVKRADK